MKSNVIFYKIVYNGAAYVGELSTPDFLGYHFKFAKPWLEPPKIDPNRNASRWENTLYYDVKNNGLQEVLKRMRFTSCSGQAVEDALVQSMQSFLGYYDPIHATTLKYPQSLYRTGREMFNDMVITFGARGTGSKSDPGVLVPEMLLILLTSKTSSMWNMHTNYIIRKSDRVVWEDHLKVMNATALKKREETASKFSIIYSIEVDKLPDEIASTAKHITKNNYVRLNIRNPKNQEGLKKLNKVVKASTMKSLHTQLERLRDSFEKDPDENKRALAGEIAKILDELDQMYGYTPGTKRGDEGTIQTRKKLATLSKDLDTLWSKSLTNQLFFTPTPVLQQKAKIWLDWIESSEAQSVASVISNPVDTEELEEDYKEEMQENCIEIVNACLNNQSPRSLLQKRPNAEEEVLEQSAPMVQKALFNPEYQSWKKAHNRSHYVEDDQVKIGLWITSRSNKHPDQKNPKMRLDAVTDDTQGLYMQPGAFYPAWKALQEGQPYFEWRKTHEEESLRIKTQEYAYQFGPFIGAHWKEYYPMVISYLLTQAGYEFEFTQMTHGFICKTTSLDWSIY